MPSIPTSKDLGHLTRNSEFWKMKIGVLNNIIVVFLAVSYRIGHSCADETEKSQDEAKKKTSRFGLGWWNQDSRNPELQPLQSPPTSFSQHSRPIQTPTHSPSSLGPLSQIGGHQQTPGEPLVGSQQQIQLSSPDSFPSSHSHREYESVTKSGVHAEDIRCVRSNGVTLLSAVVTAPPEFVAMPVFEDAPNVNPTVSANCAMRPNDLRERSFQMQVNHFSKCGVRVQQGSDGKEWASVTLRFPYVAGLRMAEDEYVMVMCKPQERTATSSHVIDMRGTASTEGRSFQTKKIFHSGKENMACLMSLTAKPLGGRLFNQEMTSSSVVHVGQELRLRAIVRDGDGWNFAFLKDVVISRFQPKPSRPQAFSPRFPGSSGVLDEEVPQTNTIDEVEVYRDERGPNFGSDGRNPGPKPRDKDFAESAHLVWEDGCRNPTYRFVAPYHPYRDPLNPLVVTFDFKAFMFQDMRDGETLRLTARVLACAELENCQQAVCFDDGRNGGRKRKRRNTDDALARNTSGQNNAVGNFTEIFELAVEFGSYAQTPLLSSSADRIPVVSLRDEVTTCRSVVIVVCASALFFCVGTTIAAAFAIWNKSRSSKQKNGDNRFNQGPKMQLNTRK